MERIAVLLRFASLLAVNLIGSFVFAAVPTLKLESAPVTPKTFAVFVAAFNPTTGAAQGGVAGTTFFISDHEALTAGHVLTEKSFLPHDGFTSVQIWLLHENETPIEISAGEVQTLPGKDITKIKLAAPQSFLKKYTFALSDKGSASGDVQTDGFFANTAGPQLRIAGQKLEILRVPHLERLSSRGQVLVQSRVELHATDVTLKNSLCYQLSYKPVVGLSGAPVVRGGKVIGLNSFADPSSRLKTWAVDLTGI